MDVNGLIEITSLHGVTILGRRYPVTVPTRVQRKINSRGGHLLITLHLGRVILTLLLRDFVTRNGRLVGGRSITLQFGYRERYRARLRATKMILRLLFRRITRFNRLRSIIVRNVGLIIKRAGRNAVRVCILTTDRFEVRSGARLGGKRRFTIRLSYTYVQHMGLKGRFRRDKFAETILASGTRGLALFSVGNSIFRRFLHAMPTGTARPVRRRILRTTDAFGQGFRILKCILRLRHRQSIDILLLRHFIRLIRHRAGSTGC